jgi:hypothetical protein
MDLQQSSSSFYGVQQGVLYGQNDRVDELNERILSRNQPDAPLKPNYDPRSVPTKYAIFPIISRRAPSKEPVINFMDHNVNVNFNPGNARAPPAGYSNKVDVENVLRNQFFANQNGIGKDVYVPSSNSDLYKTTVVSRPTEQPHPLLFAETQFSNTLHPNVVNSNIGRENFFNHTRTQLRGSAST